MYSWVELLKTVEEKSEFIAFQVGSVKDLVGALSDERRLSSCAIGKMYKIVFGNGGRAPRYF